MDKKPKSEVFGEGNVRHFSVGAVIKKGGKYLLIDRQTPPLGFAGIAGHVDEGEGYSEALAREIKEESGLILDQATLLFDEEIDWNWCSKGATCHHWRLFRCVVTGEIVKNPDETKSIGWYTTDELRALTLEPVWEYWFQKMRVTL